MVAKTKKLPRTSHGLRDVLFEEIEHLRSGEGDPTRAMAVANLSKQIINIARVEMLYHGLARQSLELGKPMQLGTMQLGSDAASAEKRATEQQSDMTGEAVE